MSARHTPGPWLLESDYSAVYADDGYGVHLARIYRTDFPDRRDAERARANALLISAAPDLLEALRKLLASADQYHEHLDCWLCGSLAAEPHADGCAVQAARAAIRRATGEEA